MLVLIAAFTPVTLLCQEPPSTELVKEWVHALGHEDQETRERAESKLRQAGALAADPLAEAAKSHDAEVALRARRALASIRTTRVLERIKKGRRDAGTVEMLVHLDLGVKGHKTRNTLYGRGRTDLSRYRLELRSGENAIQWLIRDDEKAWFKPNREWNWLDASGGSVWQAGGIRNILKLPDVIETCIDWHEANEEERENERVTVLRGKLKAGVIRENSWFARFTAGAECSAYVRDDRIVALKVGSEKDLNWYSFDVASLKKDVVLDEKLFDRSLLPALKAPEKDPAPSAPQPPPPKVGSGVR